MMNLHTAIETNDLSAFKKLIDSESLTINEEAELIQNRQFDFIKVLIDKHKLSDLGKVMLASLGDKRVFQILTKGV